MWSSSRWSRGSKDIPQRPSCHWGSSCASLWFHPLHWELCEIARDACLGICKDCCLTKGATLITVSSRGLLFISAIMNSEFWKVEIALCVRPIHSSNSLALEHCNKRRCPFCKATSATQLIRERCCLASPVLIILKAQELKHVVNVYVRWDSQLASATSLWRQWSFWDCSSRSQS